MKKFILAISISLFSFFTVDAQDLSSFRFGFQASPNFSWMTTDVNFINPNGIIPGLKLGAVSEYYFQPNYAITSGIGFSFNTGGRLLNDFPGTYWSETNLGIGVDTLAAGTNLKYNLQYVEIPVGLKMRTREFGYLRYFVEIPIITLGFESQARGTVSTTTRVSEDPQAIEDVNIREEIFGLSISWGFGGGAEYSLSQTTSLIAGLYYQRYIIDITDNNGMTFHNTLGNLRNTEKTVINNITLRLGVIF